MLKNQLWGQTLNQAVRFVNGDIFYTTKQNITWSVKTNIFMVNACRGKKLRLVGFDILHDFLKVDKNSNYSLLISKVIKSYKL